MIKCWCRNFNIQVQPWMMVVNNTFNIIIMIMKIICSSYSNRWYYKVHPFKNCQDEEYQYLYIWVNEFTLTSVHYRCAGTSRQEWFCLNFICSQQYLNFSVCRSSRLSADQFSLSHCCPEMRVRRTWLDWELWAWRYSNKCPNWMQWLSLRLDSTVYWPARLQPSNTLTQEFWS